MGTTGPVPEPAYAQFHFSCFRTTEVFFRKWLIFSCPFSFMLNDRKQCSHPAEALFQKLGSAFAFCDARSVFLAPHCPGGRVEGQLPPGPSPLRGMPAGASEVQLHGAPVRRARPSDRTCLNPNHCSSSARWGAVHVDHRYVLAMTPASPSVCPGAGCSHLRGR